MEQLNESEKIQLIGQLYLDFSKIKLTQVYSDHWIYQCLFSNLSRIMGAIATDTKLKLPIWSPTVQFLERFHPNSKVWLFIEKEEYNNDIQIFLSELLKVTKEKLSARGVDYDFISHFEEQTHSAHGRQEYSVRLGGVNMTVYINNGCLSIQFHNTQNTIAIADPEIFEKGSNMIIDVYDRILYNQQSLEN